MASTAASWKSILLKAMDTNAHIKHCNFMQLATIGTHGRPSNRTVVFRGFEENSDKFFVHTDLRSAKIEEIKKCPFAEICWYFTESWEQFRLNGKIEIIDGSSSDPFKLQLREKAWVKCSLKSKLQFLAPAPGLPFIESCPKKENQLEESIDLVDTFCLLVFDTEQVDYVNLKSNERLLFTCQSGAEGYKSWAYEKINP